MRPLLVPEDAVPLPHTAREGCGALATEDAERKNGARRGFCQVPGDDNIFTYPQGDCRPYIDLVNARGGERLPYQVAYLGYEFIARERMMEAHARDAQTGNAVTAKAVCIHIEHLGGPFRQKERAPDGYGQRFFVSGSARIRIGAPDSGRRIRKEHLPQQRERANSSEQNMR